jgi:hypothetical protein
LRDREGEGERTRGRGERGKCFATGGEKIGSSLFTPNVFTKVNPKGGRGIFLGE